MIIPTHTDHLTRRPLWRGAALATMTPDRPWGWIDDGAVLAEGERITWVSPASALPAGCAPDLEHDLGCKGRATSRSPAPCSPKA